MDDAPDYLGQAEKLCSYFRKVRDGLSQDDQAHWDRAMRMCERWIRLIGSRELTEDAIESYLDDIYREPHPGSGWCELSYQFKQWAWYRGFAARDRTYAKP